MRSSRYCFGVISHPADGLRHAIFELVQGDGLQVGPFCEKGCEDGFNDESGGEAAGRSLHCGFQGGTDTSRGGRLGICTHRRQENFHKKCDFGRLLNGNQPSVLAPTE